jgi:hypothetical protein
MINADPSVEQSRPSTVSGTVIRSLRQRADCFPRSMPTAWRSFSGNRRAQFEGNAAKPIPRNSTAKGDNNRSVMTQSVTLI